jgi:hypothetical protein
MAGALSDHDFVFVGGLHRSGTSLIADLISRSPGASRLEGTGVPEDEGQHLQEVFPRAILHGGAGRFAFSAMMHLDESSPLCTPESAQSLLDSWGPYWNLECRVLVEKSPPNLLKGPFLQALFPRSAFVMVMRHPIAVAEATRKWARTVSKAELIHHWVTAYEIMAEDLPKLHRVVVVRYEDLVERPERELERIRDLVGLHPGPVAQAVRAQINQKYYQAWLSGGVLARRDRDRAARQYGERVERFGYGLTEPHVRGELPEEFTGTSSTRPPR